MSSNENSNQNPPPAAQAVPAPEAWIGLDWGNQKHAFALQDRSGQSERGFLEHSPENLHQWLRQIGQRYGGRPVALAIEASRGAVIHALLNYAWLTIYPVNPITSARYRVAFTPSGAKDDQPDADVLLELVRDHAAKLRPLEVQDPHTVKLTELVQVRRDIVDRRTQTLNQTTSLLKTYYPQALELAGELNTDMALDFLSRWPDLISLKAAKPATIKRFYYQHHVRSTELVQERLEFIQKAEALTTETCRVSVAVLQVRHLVDPLRAFRKHISLFDKEIHNAFREHPEAALYSGFARRGPTTGAPVMRRLWHAAQHLSRSGQLAEERGRSPSASQERQPTLDPLAVAGAEVSAPDLCGVGRANSRSLPLGHPLLRAHEEQGQKARGHSPRPGLQVDAHLVEMLEGPQTL
jgi:hypothetical protein